MEFESNYSLNMFGGDNPEGSSSNKCENSSEGPKGPKKPDKPSFIGHPQSEKTNEDDNTNGNILENLEKMLAKSQAQIKEHKAFLKSAADPNVNSDKLYMEHYNFSNIVKDRIKDTGQLIRAEQVHVIPTKEYVDFMEKNNNTLSHTQAAVIKKVDILANSDDPDATDSQRLNTIYNKCVLDCLERAEKYINNSMNEAKFK
jgi:hypothetical protein